MQRFKSAGFEQALRQGERRRLPVVAVGLPRSLSKPGLLNRCILRSRRRHGSVVDGGVRRGARSRGRHLHCTPKHSEKPLHGTTNSS